MFWDYFWILLGIFVLAYVAKETFLLIRAAMKNQGAPTNAPMKNGLLGVLGGAVPVIALIIFLIFLAYYGIIETLAQR